jgi:flagellin
MNVSNLASASDGARQAAASALSSGKRIASAAVDPSGLAVSEALLTQATSDTQGAANAQGALDAANVADGALVSISNEAVQLQTLAVSGNNDLLSSSDRAALQTQADQTSQEIDTVAQSANFNGLSLLSGANSSATVQTGAAQGDTVTLALPSAKSNTLDTASVDLSSSAAAATSETSAGAGLATLATDAATLGAQQVALGIDQQNSQAASVNLTAASAAIADADAGTAATSLVNAQARQTLQLELQSRLAASRIAGQLSGP